MAKLKRAAKTIAAQSPKPMKVNLGIQLSTETAIYYVNHAEVSHIQQEFGLLVARLPTKLTLEQQKAVKQSGTLTVEAVVQLLFSPTIVPGLINALQTQMGLYEQN